MDYNTLTPSQCMKWVMEGSRQRDGVSIGLLEEEDRICACVGGK